nr:hypothetical protein CFP56_30853 [Quercus suber]
MSYGSLSSAAGYGSKTSSHRARAVLQPDLHMAVDVRCRLLPSNFAESHQINPIDLPFIDQPLESYVYLLDMVDNPTSAATLSPGPVQALDFDLFWKLPPELRTRICNFALADNSSIWEDNTTWLIQSKSLFEQAGPLLYGRDEYHHQLDFGDVNVPFGWKSDGFYGHCKRTYGEQNAPIAFNLALRMIRKLRIEVDTTDSTKYWSRRGYDIWNMGNLDLEQRLGECSNGLRYLKNLKQIRFLIQVSSSACPPLRFLQSSRVDKESLASFYAALEKDEGCQWLRENFHWRWKLKHVVAFLREAVPKGCKVHYGEEGDDSIDPAEMNIPQKARISFAKVLYGLDDSRSE